MTDARHSNDWLPELGDDDLEVLLEALEAWEAKDLASDIMGDMLEHMVAGRDPEARAQMLQQRESQKRDKEAAKRLRKERSVLLRAKLITIRDRRHSERMTQDALQRP